MKEAEPEEGEEPFEGIEIESPLGGIRLGRGGGRRFRIDVGGEEDAYRAARRRVRRKLRFFRHATTYVLLNLGLFLIDLATGGGFWVQWVAAIWGAFLAWHFLSTLVLPALWGPDLERRMIERELRRREGR